MAASVATPKPTVTATATATATATPSARPIRPREHMTGPVYAMYMALTVGSLLAGGAFVHTYFRTDLVCVYDMIWCLCCVLTAYGHVCCVLCVVYCVLVRPYRIWTIKCGRNARPKRKQPPKGSTEHERQSLNPNHPLTLTLPLPLPPPPSPPLPPPLPPAPNPNNNL